MASKAVKEKDDHIIQNFIDKEPIRFNVAFTAAFIISGQVVVPIPFLKSFPICKPLHNFKQFLSILALLLSQFQISLKLACKFNFVSHCSSAAFNSSMLV